MENPFAYSTYVTGESFCNRSGEIAELIKHIKTSQNVLLYSHRRYGKSSLIQQIFNQIRANKMNIGTMHVDLYGTISENDFITKTFHCLNQIESNVEKLLKSVSQALRTIKLTISIDPASGSTTVSPSFKAASETAVLEELMNLLHNYSQKRRLVIAFDEFQEVAHYSEETFEKRLRSFIQKHTAICYIFSGSQRHLITDMFNSSSRAFYKMAESFPLGKIATKQYLPWIQNLFRKNKVQLPVKLIEEIIARFENHPMHIQNFLFHLWEESSTKEISRDTIDRIEGTIIEKKGLEYTALWENLTINQKKTLKLILLNEGANLYNADSLQSVNLKTASLVTKALSTLLHKELIAKNGNYQIQDVLFKKWLQKILSL